MSSSIDLRYILRPIVKSPRVCGVAGVMGFLLATAAGYLGANQADIRATTTKTDPGTSPSLSDQRQDRLDPPRQWATKTDRLHDPVPASKSSLPTQKHITIVETPAAPEFNEPLHLVPWLEGETVTLSGPAPSEPVSPITPDLLDKRLIEPAPVAGLKATNSQQGSSGLASAASRTSGVAGRASGVAGRASGVAGRASGGLGL
jgi:hypothetical protein